MVGFPLTSQVQPVPLALTFVYPAGKISVMFTSAASSGPLFVTSNVNVTFCPAMTGFVTIDLSIIMSVPAVTLRSSVSVLLLGSTSRVSELTLAALVIFPMKLVTCTLK